MHETDLSFSRLTLPKGQLDNLSSLGYRQMTPIQSATLPKALAGEDLLAQAKTGSGKTAAFSLPLLTRLNPRDFGTQALVMCPTRELATQVAGEIRRLARYQQNIKVVTLCGGQPIGPQIGSLAHGAHVVVGTPGRIKDHLRKNTLDVGRVQTLVLDEADRMLEMGFVDDIAAIISNTPDSRQTLFFSATYPNDIRKMSGEFQRNPNHIALASSEQENKIQEALFVCNRSEKLATLGLLLRHFRPASAVVFCNTKNLVREVHAELRKQSIEAGALHGDMEQRERDLTLTRFRQQSCSILVATDVAARGLDIDDLPAVVNYELPRDAEVYVHRIGRTGRAGKEGLALSLITDTERYKVETIERYVGRELPFHAPEEVEEAADSLPAPPYVTLCIAGGRKQKVRPGDILGALTGDAGLHADSVGNIQITDHVAYVAIVRSQANLALKRLSSGKIKGRKFKVRRL